MNTYLFQQEYALPRHFYGLDEALERLWVVAGSAVSMIAADKEKIRVEFIITEASLYEATDKATEIMKKAIPGLEFLGDQNAKFTTSRLANTLNLKNGFIPFNHQI